MKVSVSETIAAPIETTFALMADIPEAAKHIPAIDKLDILSDITNGIGFRWRETRLMFGKEATEDMEITHFDPPNAYHSQAQSHGTQYLTQTTFTQIDPNTTKVATEFTGIPISLIAKLMTPLALAFKGSMIKALQKDLQDLKHYIESQ